MFWASAKVRSIPGDLQKKIILKNKQTLNTNNEPFQSDD